MDRKILQFIALVVTLIFGAVVALVDENRQTIAIAGGMVVALAWVVVGTFGKDTASRD
ncbi:hypothetical protein [Demetria terragena]|uniref:hypothetical protein n=1 Tax=Demetria terragena TaxID=63959 RepID=UPI0003619AED|nr:hypothetical protein [Demetria terragena]